MERKPLSKRQQRVYDFLKVEIRKNGYPPAIREICIAMGLSSTATVHTHLKTLEEKGYIRRLAGKNRCIEMVDDEAGLEAPKSEYADVPIIGRVNAGGPILAAENLEGFFPVPVDFLGNADAFMLRVKGDSMEGAGIFQNDLILVRRQPDANNGDIVVALLEDSATVKRFYKEQNYIRLHSENPIYSDILSRSAQVIGKVIGLFRQIR